MCNVYNIIYNLWYTINVYIDKTWWEKDFNDAEQSIVWLLFNCDK